MLYKRVISGLLFLPVFYLAAWRLSPVYFTALVLIAVVIGQYEFYRMVRARGSYPHEILGIAFGFLVVFQFYRPLFPGTETLDIMTGGVFAIIIARLFSARTVDGAVGDVGSTLLGVFYVALLFAFQVAIRTGNDGREWIVFLYLIIWASDIGAYSIGIPFGKRRLYRKISPKKSIEGFLGALAASGVTAYVCKIWFMPPLGTAEAIAIALVLAVAGTLGDLAESLFKRAAGVKDSGGIIPGHGGVLDRMDSLLFAAPVLYYYLRIF